MKKISIITILLSIVHFSWIDLTPVPKKLEKILANYWAYIPSGNSKLGENMQNIEAFYISKTEISNLEYLKFLKDLKTKNSSSYNIALPDTTVWNIGSRPQKAFENQYFRYPGFQYYPVVGVSFDAAVLYCKWVEDKINAQLGTTEKVEVRLPTEAEWIRAARGDKHTSVFPWGGPNLQNRKGHNLANYKKDKPKGFEGQIITSEVMMFPQNEFGIYQMSGNVAEMISEPQKVKGGSWNSTAKSLEIDASENINYPASNVGFRPILLVK